MNAYSLSEKRIFVAGHNGMVGQALMRALSGERPAAILTAPRSELDLRDPAATGRWLAVNRPDVVFVAAAKVGGILANSTQPVSFLFDNLEIASTLIRASFEAGVERLVYLGSSCIYPREAEQPMREDQLLTGPLEPTNEWYAIAKIAGVKMCQAMKVEHGARYISVMPTNLYGPGDNFDLASSHVIPALMRKAHEAKQAGADHMAVWGSGRPRREFMHVDDCARGIIHAAKHYDDLPPINVSWGEDVTIREAAELIAAIVGFDGQLRFDPSKPDGTARKLMDASRLNALGWRARIGLEDGLRATYAWFVENEVQAGAA